MRINCGSGRRMGRSMGGSGMGMGRTQIPTRNGRHSRKRRDKNS